MHDHLSHRGIFCEDFFLFMCVYMCLHACMYTFLQMYKGARKGQLDFQVVLIPLMWMLEAKLRSPRRAASALNH